MGRFSKQVWGDSDERGHLYRVLAVLLVLIAIALAWNHFGDLNPLELHPLRGTLLGIAAGVGIGIVSSVKVWRHD